MVNFSGRQRVPLTPNEGTKTREGIFSYRLGDGSASRHAANLPERYEVSACLPGLNRQESVPASRALPETHEDVHCLSWSGPKAQITAHEAS